MERRGGVPRRDPRSALVGIEQRAPPMSAGATRRRACAKSLAHPAPPPPAFYQSPFTGPAHAPPRPSRPRRRSLRRIFPRCRRCPRYPRSARGPSGASGASCSGSWDEERRRRERMALKSRAVGEEIDAGRPVAERISSWRRRAFGGISSIVGLATVNVLTSPQHMWFVFPGVFIFLGVVSHAGRLWADGVPVVAAVHSPHVERGRAGRRLTVGAAAGRSTWMRWRVDSRRHTCSRARMARRCVAPRRTAPSVEETLGRLAPAEREMIPDVLPTVISLAERVGSLATTLHGLDADVNTRVGRLTRSTRSPSLKAEAGTSRPPSRSGASPCWSDSARTIAELMERRGTLSESARERESRAAQPPTRSHQAPLVGIGERDVRPDERDAGSARDQSRRSAMRWTRWARSDGCELPPKYCVDSSTEYLGLPRRMHGLPVLGDGHCVLRTSYMAHTGYSVLSAAYGSVAFPARDAANSWGFPPGLGTRVPSTAYFSGS